MVYAGVHYIFPEPIFNTLHFLVENSQKDQ